MEPVNKQDFCDLKGALDSCKKNLSLENAESLILKDDLEKCKEAKVEGEKNFMVHFTKLTLELRQSTTDLRREISALNQDISATSMLAASNVKEISVLKQEISALKQDNSDLQSSMGALTCLLNSRFAQLEAIGISMTNLIHRCYRGPVEAEMPLIAFS